MIPLPELPALLSQSIPLGAQRIDSPAVGTNVTATPYGF
jgi:hypothetical protein